MERAKRKLSVSSPSEPVPTVCTSCHRSGLEDQQVGWTCWVCGGTLVVDERQKTSIGAGRSGQGASGGPGANGGPGRSTFVYGKKK